MLFNLRCKCTNNNGAAATYTWRKVECDSEANALALAKQWGEATEKEHKAPNVSFPFQTKSVEPSLPSDKVLEEEDHARWDEMN